MNRSVTELEFEKPLGDIRSSIERLQRANLGKVPDAAAQIAKLEAQYDLTVGELYSQLSPWHEVQISRHPQRPRFLDYARTLFSDFVELHGDRHFGDDGAIVAGPATFAGRSVMLIGEQKGRSTKENIARNFGMPHPEGYRKAERLMRQANKFGLPILTFVDTSGASSVKGDEERGQSWAIAAILRTMAELRVPILTVILGEGNSGGAIAIAMGNRVLMLEHATYSTIAPEACAMVLWRDPAAAPEAAAQMQITARQLCHLGLVDRVVPEPLGGAQRDPAAATAYLQGALLEEFARLSSPGTDWAERRYERYRAFGRFETEALPGAG
jgi:acetyl-CoA carboxylase carboxyl transferase subunit alpha